MEFGKPKIINKL